MKSFFENFSLDDAELVESLSRVIYELRENRGQLLAQYGVEEAAALLEKIAMGELEEHPAYEHYLSARILDETRETIRGELGRLLQEVKLV